MKKLGYCCIFIILMMFAQNVTAAPMAALGATSITGGSGSLDAIPYTKYRNGSLAFVPVIGDDVIYFYMYDGTINSPEDLPDIVIPNDNTTGMGAWKKILADGASGSPIETIPNAWLYGDGIPADEYGNEDDFYLDTGTSDVYVKDGFSTTNQLEGGTVTSDIVDAALAFDGVFNTYTTSTVVPASITYDLGVGNGTVPKSAMVSVPGTNTATDISISGSNDNTEWTVLGSMNDTTTNSTKFIQFDTDISYRYFKITCTEASDEFSISEFEIYPDRLGWSMKVNLEGNDGRRGSVWYTGLVDPGITPPEPNENDEILTGDYYLDTATANVYRFESTEGDPPLDWVLKGNLRPTGYISTVGLDVEPPDPDNGNFVIWMNNVDQLQDAGIAGAAGDIMIKVKIDGLTKIQTIFDYSAAVNRSSGT